MTAGESWAAILTAWLVACVGLWQWTVALDRRDARRRRHEDQAIALTRPMRCLACPGAPVIYDYTAHTRLCHQPREVGPEDMADWGTR